ncbi:hypothetical protein QFC19_004807 [Naganishia cerealis]|uniref:Uncharacterized protein n=1 Tax=Naganishia cerealis TaxID=610337 RepID=A0ACC2VT37_9TREE|nr:hypothetical protein QFC19_004807 [Naganishia cerealis]
MSYESSPRHSFLGSASPSYQKSEAETNPMEAMLNQLDEDNDTEPWERYDDDGGKLEWCSWRGLFNLGTIFVLLAGLICLFAVLPITTQLNADRRAAEQENNTGWSYNLGGINATGQIAARPRELIDPDTPLDVYKRTGFDGKSWSLAFSDEFNTDGRTFFPGDDPFWEGVDLHYHGTNDFEWYDPSAIHTEGGSLIITQTQERINDLNFKSGMLQSWNKVCFWGSMYIEDEHPGPNITIGRNVPEIDLIEAQIEVSRAKGQVSQSFQVAPFNGYYKIDNTSVDVFDETISSLNSYWGGQYQQAASYLTDVEDQYYVDNSPEFGVFGFESYSNENTRGDNYITWVANGKPSWTLPAAAIGPDSGVDVGQRLISEEPMYMIMNFGLSNNFESVTFTQLEWPNRMGEPWRVEQRLQKRILNRDLSLAVDYVRVWVQDDYGGVGCSPSHRPTQKYINDHIDVYSKWPEHDGMDRHYISVA